MPTLPLRLGVLVFILLFCGHATGSKLLIAADDATISCALEVADASHGVRRKVHQPAPGCVSTTKPGIQMADRETILEFKALRGKALRVRYGAHSLGIGRRRIDGVKTDELALAFYVSSASTKPASSIPPSFRFQPAGSSSSVIISTTIVEVAPPDEEPALERPK